MSRPLALIFFGVIYCSTSFAAEPAVPLDQVAPVDVLLVEVDDRIKELTKLTASEEAYEEGTDMAIPTAAGVLACIGQGLALHKDSPDKVNALGLRDAALALADAGDLEEAKAALTSIEKTRSGGGEPGDAEAEYTFGELIGGYELMEEINTRTSKIARVARRPRGKPEEAAHAAVIALLCLPMYDQAEDYVDESDAEDYRHLTLKYLNELAETTEAISAKDGKKALQLLLKSKQTCDECHKKYRDGE